MKIHNMDYSIY